MRTTVEREIKLDVAPEFEIPALPGEPLATRTFTSTYWDTAGRGLAHVGITLRHRVEHGRGRWQLKIPHGLARLEIEADGGPLGPPAELTALLTAFTRREPLARAAVLYTHRAGRRIDDGKGAAVAEAVVDAVSVLDGNWVIDRFAELEVELVEAGDERDLRRIELQLRAAGALDGDGRPKVLRALGIGGDADPPAELTAAPTQARITEAFARQRRVVLSRDPGTRLGSDPEDLHDMRVATRRLRSYLRAAHALVDPAWATPLRAELGWLADELGSVRDLDVMLAHLAPQVATLDPAEREALEGVLLDRLRRDHERARAALLATLSSPRYFRLLDLLEQPVALVVEPPLDEQTVAEPLIAEPLPSLQALAANEYRRLRRALRRIDETTPDVEIHATRIRAKRARYAAELAQPLAGRKLSAVLARIKALQDVLGEHQDSAVAEECIRRLAGKCRGDAALGAGRLIEREHRRRAAARAALPAAMQSLDRAARKAFR